MPFSRTQARSIDYKSWIEQLNALRQGHSPEKALLADLFTALQRGTVQIADEALAKRLTLLGDIEHRFEQIADLLEELPIEDEDIRTRPQEWMFFLLDGGRWYPCAVGNISRMSIGGQLGDWLNYRIDLKDGSCESGSARPGYWAHCNADRQPSIMMDMGGEAP